MIREEQEVAAGAACVSQSAEFALPGVASRVRMCCARVFACAPIGNVCSTLLLGWALGLRCLCWAAGFGSYE